MRWKSVVATLGAAALVVVLPITPSQASSFVQITPNPINFGAITGAGATDRLLATVTNTSSVPIDVIGDAAAAPFSLDQTSAPETPRPGACSYFSPASSVFKYSTVAPGASCKIYYSYTPTEIGTFTDNVDVGVYDAAGGPAVENDTLVLEGSSPAPETAATTGGLTVSSTALGFGSVYTGDSNTQTLTLTNTSNGKAQVKPTFPSGATFVNASTSSFDDCVNAINDQAIVLSMGDSCHLEVAFEPAKTGAATGSLILSEVGSSAPLGTTVPLSSTATLITQSLELSGTGVVATSTTSPATLSFGSIQVGGAKALTLKVKNTSKTSLRYSTTYAAGSAYSDASQLVAGDANACANPSGGKLVAPNGTCDLPVEFSPTSLGTLPGIVTVHMLKPNGSANVDVGTIPVRATGTATQATYKLSATTAAFGKITTGTTKTITITATNTASVGEYFSPQFAANEPYTVQFPLPGEGPDPNACTNGAAREVLPGGTCTLDILFAPGLNDVYSESLPLNVTRATGSGGTAAVGTSVIKLSGTAVAPTYTLTPSLAFGNVTVGGSKVLVVTAKNTSQLALKFRGEFPAGSDYQLQFRPPHDDGGACYSVADGPTLIEPGASCTISIVFTPTRLGSDPGSVTLEVNSMYGFDSSPVGFSTVKLTGSGIAPTYTFSPTSLAFGKVAIGGRSEKSFGIKNTSAVTLLFTPEYPAGSAYSISESAINDSSACTTTAGTTSVAPGSQCTLIVEFQPTVKGAANASIPVDVASWMGTGATPIAVGTRTISVTGTGM